MGAGGPCFSHPEPSICLPGALSPLQTDAKSVCQLDVCKHHGCNMRDYITQQEQRLLLSWTEIKNRPMVTVLTGWFQQIQDRWTLSRTLCYRKVTGRIHQLRSTGTVLGLHFRSPLYDHVYDSLHGYYSILQVD